MSGFRQAAVAVGAAIVLPLFPVTASAGDYAAECAKKTDVTDRAVCKYDAMGKEIVDLKAQIKRDDARIDAAKQRSQAAEQRSQAAERLGVDADKGKQCLLDLKGL